LGDAAVRPRLIFDCLSIDHWIGNRPRLSALSGVTGGFAMRVFLGMILGALLLVACVYVYDSQTTSTVASGQNASNSRTIVNWDVAAADWKTLKLQAHEDWIRLSSR
jgi:hypothetical protein